MQKLLKMIDLNSTINAGNDKFQSNKNKKEEHESIKSWKRFKRMVTIMLGKISIHTDDDG